MKRRGLLACLCLFLAACSEPDPVPPAPGQSDLVLNVKGGYFRRVALPLAEKDASVVELMLEGINEDPTWGALANLCMQADQGSDQVCLRFQIVERGSLQLQAKLITGTDSELLTSEDLPGHFVVGKSIRIEMHSSPGSVRFRIGGHRPVTRAVQFSPRVLVFACSSAVCKARLT